MLYMRRRLKTTKKEKTVVSKPKAVKSAKKTPKKSEEIVPKKKALSVRVLGQKKKLVEEKPEPIIDEKVIAAELEKRKEESQSAKPAYLRAAVPSAQIEKSARDLEKQKQVIMWTGITFCMILIAFFWLSSTRRVVEESGENMQEKSQASKTWDQAVDELSDKINEMEVGVNSINSFGKVTVPNQGTSTPVLPDLILPTASSSASSSLPVLNKEEFEKIDQKIQPEVKEKIRFIY